jgi:hypothetical protein
MISGEASPVEAAREQPMAGMTIRFFISRPPMHPLSKSFVYPIKISFRFL